MPREAIESVRQSDVLKSFRILLHFKLLSSVFLVRAFIAMKKAH